MKSGMKKTVWGLMAAGLAATVWNALAGPVPEAAVPLPYVKPNAPAVPAFMPASPEITGAIPRLNRPDDANQLKAGLDALSSRDTTRAIAVRNAMQTGSLDRHILTWAIAISGQKDVPSAEITTAQSELAGWPGAATLRANSEKALYRENPPSPQVLAAFGSARPETAEGTVVLAKALTSSGKALEAQRLIRQLWVSEGMDKDMEDRVLAEFPTYLTPADHKARMDYLMYRSRIGQAKRFGDLGKAQSLYNAWAAVLQRSGNAVALLGKVDANLRSDPAFLFARIENLRNQQKYPEAAALLKQAPKDAAKLVNPGEWWNERRIIARGVADLGDFAGGSSHRRQSFGHICRRCCRCGIPCRMVRVAGTARSRHGFTPLQHPFADLEPATFRLAGLLLAWAGGGSGRAGQCPRFLHQGGCPFRYLLRPACRRTNRCKDAERHIPCPERCRP